MSRRPTKSTAASRSNAATAFSTGYERPPTSSHLDLSSANDDDTTNTTTSSTSSGSKKIHKKSMKQQLHRQKGSSIILATACCVISLCTIYYVATQFSYMTKHHLNSSLSIHHEQKMAVSNNQDDDNNEPNNHQHQHHHNNLHLPPDSIYRTELTDIHNKPQSLLQYAGSISLILCEKQTHEKVEWNFHKYLVDGSGRAVRSYGHRVDPLDIEEDIVRLLDDREMMKVPQTH
eukprot:scaffold5793_cov146-Skeletonema_menzelii.AAC.5